MNHSGKIFKLGMLGLGTVGAGVAKILRESRPPLVDKTGLDIRLHKIAVRDLKKARALPVDPALLTDDAMSVATDPEIDILVEVIGGIDPRAHCWPPRSTPANPSSPRTKRSSPLTQGTLRTRARQKKFPSASKPPSARRARRRCHPRRLVANRIESIHAILNGTTNYILTRMIQSQAPYAQALYEAQSKGYAEADLPPT